MWRLEAEAPQGPMQVSASAAADSGGGDRFDLTENRVLGRAYLARLYRHYGIGRTPSPPIIGAPAKWMRGSRRVARLLDFRPAWSAIVTVC
jgi:hypothetical protein